MAECKRTLQERPCLFPGWQNNAVRDVKPLIDQIVANLQKDSRREQNQTQFATAMRGITDAAVAIRRAGGR